MRSKIGFGTSFGLASLGVADPSPDAPANALRPLRYQNLPVFHPGARVTTDFLTAELWAETQIFHLHSIAQVTGPIGDGDLLPASVAPINSGLVFCLGSHPNGSTLLGRDLVSRTPGNLLASGNLTATNADHGTWRCLESTSLTNGGIAVPSSSQLRSITTQRTFAFHGEIDAFGAWSALISIPYAASTWVQPWMSHGFRRQSSTGANLNIHFATGGTGYASVNSTGGWATGRHWFVVALDGVAGVARFYVDGAQVGGDVGISTASVDWGGAQPVVIFNRSDSNAGEGTDGRCFTAAVWNRVLSAAEIVSLDNSPQQMFSTGGGTALTATKYVNEQAYGLHKLANPNTIFLTATSYAEPQIYHDHVVTLAPSGNGDVPPLEPPDLSALQVDIDVGTSPRQAWIGYGWGVVNVNLSQWTNTVLTRLCEDMNATVVRFHTPETGAPFVTKYLDLWNILRTRTIDTIFASCYVYRTANNPQESAKDLTVPSNPPNITGAADGIHHVRTNGINPTNGFWVNLQNEPDGSPYNHPTVGGVGNASQAQINQHHATFREQLNTLGSNAIKVLGLEWRHPQTLATEYDAFNSAGNDFYDNGYVQGQCFHIYDDGATPTYYDNRLQQNPNGLEFFSTETGDNGKDPTASDPSSNPNSPYTAARFISGLNHGVQVEIHHIAMGGVDGDGKVQVLLNNDGTMRPWYQASKIISSHLKRGMIFRLCTSSDRPTSPTLPDNNASRMIIESSSASPCQPRQLVGCGRRTDGRWVLVAVNFAYDSKSEQPLFAGGHYAAATQQLTVTIPEQSSVDRVWSGQRASRTGSTTNITVNMRTGIMRFTLAPGETIAITQDVAASLAFVADDYVAPNYVAGTL